MSALPVCHQFVRFLHALSSEPLMVNTRCLGGNGLLVEAWLGQSQDVHQMGCDWLNYEGTATGTPWIMVWFNTDGHADTFYENNNGGSSYRPQPPALVGVMQALSVLYTGLRMTEVATQAELTLAEIHLDSNGSSRLVARLIADRVSEQIISFESLA
jgi:hypothetical protein